MLGDFGMLINYLVTFNSQVNWYVTIQNSTEDQAKLALWITIGVLAFMSILWTFLTACCYCSWKKSKGADGPTTVTYIEQGYNGYEVGGGANVELELTVEAPVVEVEIEVPQVEIEVELEAPEVELEVEVEAEVEVELEVEAEVELDAGIEVEVEIGA